MGIRAKFKNFAKGERERRAVGIDWVFEIRALQVDDCFAVRSQSHVFIEKACEGVTPGLGMFETSGRNVIAFKAFRKECNWLMKRSRNGVDCFGESELWAGEVHRFLKVVGVEHVIHVCTHSCANRSRVFRIAHDDLRLDERRAGGYGVTHAVKDRVTYVANAANTVVASRDDGRVPIGVGADGPDGFKVQRVEV